MSERFSFDFGPGSGRPRRAVPFRPMCMLLLGDFSGTAGDAAGATPSRAGRRPQPVDAESLDRVVSKLEPQVHVSSAIHREEATISLRRLSDFHPDSLCNRVPWIRSLCDVRRRLLDPQTFEQAAAEVRATSDHGPAAVTPAPEPARTPVRALRTTRNRRR